MATPSTSTTSSSTTSSSTRSTEVDLDALACPGCAEPVHAGGPVLGFSHQDGSELCPDSTGAPVEPVETRGLWWPAA